MMHWRNGLVDPPELPLTAHLQEKNKQGSFSEIKLSKSISLLQQLKELGLATEGTGAS